MSPAKASALLLIAALLLLLGVALSLTGPALAAEQGEGWVAGAPLARLPDVGVSPVLPGCASATVPNHARKGGLA